MKCEHFYGRLNFHQRTCVKQMPLCGTDPMLVLEFSMLILESYPTQAIEHFSSGNIPADLVNSYLKHHASNLQGRYLELMLAMNENGISGKLQNEMIQIYLCEVLDWHSELSSQQKLDEKTYSPTRRKLLSALESISGYNPEALLKHLPAEALYEERALLLGKMNQHELALSLYVHKVFFLKEKLLTSRLINQSQGVQINHCRGPRGQRDQQRANENLKPTYAAAPFVDSWWITWTS